MPPSVPAGWTQEENALTRTCRRAGFVDALALTVEVGRLAETADHHPDIDLRYRTLHLRLSTHSAGHTVTEKDFALAQQINDLSEARIGQTRDELERRFKNQTPPP